MSRLRFVSGNEVQTKDGFVLVVVNIQPALDKPYFLSDNKWYADDELHTFVPPAPTWEQIEGYIKDILVAEVRKLFADRDASYMNLSFSAHGTVHGDLKIKYSVSTAQYATGVEGYSVRNCVDELFRRNNWDKLNKPDALTYSGETKTDDETTF